jgi:hypothetical protein
MFVLNSPMNCSCDPLAANGLEVGGNKVMFLIPGNWALTQVTSAPVSISQVQGAFPTFPATCIVLLLSFGALLHVDACHVASTFTSLKAWRDTARPYAPVLSRCGTERSLRLAGLDLMDLSGSSWRCVLFSRMRSMSCVNVRDHAPSHGLGCLGTVCVAVVKLLPLMLVPSRWG